MIKQSSYERTAAALLKGQPKARKIARFIDGKLCAGHDTLHRTRQSRTWRLFWRLKFRREKRVYNSGIDS